MPTKSGRKTRRRAASLRVYGEPKPQARPRLGWHGRQAVVFSPKEPWHVAMQLQARLRRPRPPLDGPLSLSATFIMPRPQRPRYGRWAIGRADLDNLVKALMDAMQRADWFRNDAQVVEFSPVSKRYSADGWEEPGVEARVAELGAGLDGGP